MIAKYLSKVSRITFNWPVICRCCTLLQSGGLLWANCMDTMGVCIHIWSFTQTLWIEWYPSYYKSHSLWEKRVHFALDSTWAVNDTSGTFYTVIPAPKELFQADIDSFFEKRRAVIFSFRARLTCGKIRSIRMLPIFNKSYETEVCCHAF